MGVNPRFDWTYLLKLCVYLKVFLHHNSETWYVSIQRNELSNGNISLTIAPNIWKLCMCAFESIIANRTKISRIGQVGMFPPVGHLLKDQYLESYYTKF